MEKTVTEPDPQVVSTQRTNREPIEIVSRQRREAAMTGELRRRLAT